MQRSFCSAVACSSSIESTVRLMEGYCWLRQMTFLKIVAAFTEDIRLQMVQSARVHFFPKAEAYMNRFAGLMERM